MNAPTLGAGTPRRIVVFRALQLGDMLCAVPALRALRQAFPRAGITLLGLAGAREFVDRFQAYVDDLIEFPGIAAFPEQPSRPAELPGFLRRVRALRPDVALQMHGSGTHSNRIVDALGAAWRGGFVARRQAQEAGRYLLWPDTLPGRSATWRCCASWACLSATTGWSFLTARPTPSRPRPCCGAMPWIPRGWY